jgi:hypothetical protein
VYPLASALLYQQHILPKIEFQREMENMPGCYFRALKRAARVSRRANRGGFPSGTFCP